MDDMVTVGFPGVGGDIATEVGDCAFGGDTKMY